MCLYTADNNGDETKAISCADVIFCNTPAAPLLLLYHLSDLSTSTFPVPDGRHLEKLSDSHLSMGAFTAVSKLPEIFLI